jgi:hypothetical protein
MSERANVLGDRRSAEASRGAKLLRHREYSTQYQDMQVSILPKIAKKLINLVRIIDKSSMQ